MVRPRLGLNNTTTFGRLSLGDYVWATTFGRLRLGDYVWATTFGRLRLGDYVWTTTFGRLRCWEFRTAEHFSFHAEIDGTRKIIYS